MTVQGSRNCRWGRGKTNISKPSGQPEVSNLGKKTWPFTKSEYCPDALVNYVIADKLCLRRRGDIVEKARKHLVYMGWKVEFVQDRTMVRTRYISSKGKAFYSLLKLCKHLTETEGNIKARTPRSSQNVKRSSVDLADQPLNSRVQQAPFLKILDQNRESEGSGSTSLGKNLELDHSKREARAVGVSSPLSEPLSLDISEGEVAVADPGSMVVRHEYGSQAVEAIYKCDIREKNVKELRKAARDHLKAMGWTVWNTYKKQHCELRYTSPRGKCYYSLRTACKGFMDEGLPESARPIPNIITGEESNGLLTYDVLSSAIVSTEVEEDVLPVNRQPGKSYTEASGFSESRELEFGNVKVKKVRGPRKRRKDGSYPLIYMLLQSDVDASLYTRQEGMSLAVSSYKTRGKALDHNASVKNQRKQKAFRILTRKGVNLHGSYPSRELRSNKRARQVVASNPAHHTPKTVLSWLIDNNQVLPRQKVFYKNRKTQRIMAEGKITRDGIRCNCCQKVFGISRFEAHAGSTNHRPATNIFLEDGRSLLQCQKQMVQENKLKGFTAEPYQRIKSYQPHNDNDSICSVCHYGGTLVLCDQCPSSYHLSCVGLEDLPKGKWFCPSCRCGICGKSEFNGNVEQFTEKTVLYCDQCEREYHVGCIKKRTLAKFDCCPKGNWFCSKKCEKIFMGLHRLLGRPIPVGVDNLSWTILKFVKGRYKKDPFDVETLTEHHSKLNVALTVMHECFEPIKESQTEDLVKDVLFNRRSALKRLNFRGFYTVLLEKEDELISVATVRVYGEKVAEVPLVGTRVQFRRQGMCRILMNVLEKKLTEFGVERLLLPAIPQVLQAWTTSFGFSKMTDSERLEFLEYTFLDFQDTTMCQKHLKMVPTLEIIVPTAKKDGLGNELNWNNGDIAFGRDNIVPQEAKENESDTMEQIPVEVTDGDNCRPIEVLPLVVMLTQQTDSKWSDHSNEMSNNEKCSIEGSDMHKENKGVASNQCLKYSRRKKMLPARSVIPVHF